MWMSRNAHGHAESLLYPLTAATVRESSIIIIVIIASLSSISKSVRGVDIHRDRQSSNTSQCILLSSHDLQSGGIRTVRYSRQRQLQMAES